MIHSMTAFGSARMESDQGSLAVEFRTVNSRFLDIQLRLPDDLRMVEGLVREHINRHIVRGKVDARLSYVRHAGPATDELDMVRLAHLDKQLALARTVMPDVVAPRLLELLSGPSDRGDSDLDATIWSEMCNQACLQALDQLQAARQREGQRLSAMMLASAQDMSAITDRVEQHLPTLTDAYHERISTRIRDVLASVSPEGFTQISGAELSARIAQEASLFSLRNDVAEELARLRSHLQELHHLLDEAPPEDDASKSKSRKSSVGKRLDFLCQEMNREANTLGSKAASLETTRAAIDLKLLIEQLREQAQNIE